MTHLEALEAQLEVWQPSSSSAAEVELARGLAALLDAGQTSADMFREYRFALRALREVAGGGDVDESISDLLARLGGTGVRDGENAGS